MNGTGSAEASSPAGSGHTPTAMYGNGRAADRAFVPWLIARPRNHAVIPARKKPPVHVVKKIRAIVVVVLNDRRIYTDLILPRGVAGSIGIHRVRRTNVLRNILDCAIAECESRNNCQQDKG
jgi:hypothetical protein